MGEQQKVEVHLAGSLDTESWSRNLCGADWIHGGRGPDLIYGGYGSDRFMEAARLTVFGSLARIPALLGPGK